MTPLIVPRPAANARSPQRRARTREPERANSYATKRLRVLQELEVGRNHQEAAEAAGMSETALKLQIFQHPEFKALVEKADEVGKKTREEARAEAKAKLEDKLLLKGDKALENYDILLDAKSVHEKTLLATSQDVLDRIGVGVERRGDVVSPTVHIHQEKVEILALLTDPKLHELVQRLGLALAEKARNEGNGANSPG